MKLTIRVLEARNIPLLDPNDVTDSYVRLILAKQRFRTKAVKKSLTPNWGEEFSFRVEDLVDELKLCLYYVDKYFNDDYIGKLKLPVLKVFDAEDKFLGPAWYSFKPKSKKFKNRDCAGEILLSLHFTQKGSTVDFNSNNNKTASQLKNQTNINTESYSSSPSRQQETHFSTNKESNLYGQKKLAARISQIFHRQSENNAASTTHTKDIDCFSDIAEGSNPEPSECCSEDHLSSLSFEEALKIMESRDQGTEIPENLPGGVLIDQSYIVSQSDLNSLLFSPDSNFFRTFQDAQGTREQQTGAWKFEEGGECLKRVLTYVKAATKLLKATKGFEEQTYLKADGNIFSVLASISSPDVICGSTFRVELLYCIKPGPKLPSGAQASQLVISWRVNFLQITMMKGMIENGVRQGLKESYEQYASLLSENLKPVDTKDLGSDDKEQVLASLQAEPQSDWKLAWQYFGNFTMVSTIFVALFMLAHIWVVTPSKIQGLEFIGLDLPDSVGEFIVCAVLVLQGERVLGSISRFMQARSQKGGDHGVKAHGDGWLLTVALVEGSNVAAADSSGLSDPYVVFTCNGKTRTSSIKFQKSDPLWNEIFEFDAMDEPPSMLDVEVFDFDGPFDEATSLGNSEINFVRSNISELADFWVPLQGKLALACQSKLHLRIFLTNTRGGNVVKEYLNKMEKEVGKKINVRSPQTNSAFQKLFGLPSEEFLINDFTCHLKRKMPLQGRLFLSARVIGYHANLFGHKTTFFFLWEDIEEIEVVAPTFSSMGSPIIVMTLWPGRGLDARHGAKTQDGHGRLKFHFQSFVSFNVAQRTIMALWKSRSLSPEQRVKIVEEESDETGFFLGTDEVSMSEVSSSSLSVPTSFFMELFNGGELDRKVMEKAGCLNYSFTPWESEKGDVYERQMYYRFDKHVSSYRGEVTSTQQKREIPNKNGWLIEEAMILHGIPFGDFFYPHFRYQIEDQASNPKGCNVKVFFGVTWLKSTKHQKRITKNVLKNFQDRFKVVLTVVEKEHSTR